MKGIIIGLALSLSSAQSTAPMIATLSTGAAGIIETAASSTGSELLAGKKKAEEALASTTAFGDRKAYVEEYFKDEPILARIAFCESTYRHLNEDGTVRRGIVNNGDIGVMQINERYHLGQATELGLDIHDPLGNLSYARYLYEKQGTQPWYASKKCWGPHEEISMAK